MKASDAVIIGTILVFDHIDYILFDPKSTLSYVLVKFSRGWDWTVKYLTLLLCVNIVEVSICLD